MDTSNWAVQAVLALAVLSAGALPALVGAARARRDTEQGKDRRTGVLITFDLAYGPHEDRVTRATTHG
ncbi:hypothetical protein OIE75_15415 [Streptomyces sp. NBC_01723]|uniref:hypothetical protein n=1 Tax=unclassified Streptomyces TaxID=2593676 RepID=UPI0027895314|nr:MULTISPECIES: hypothetical protein [unclassified Streptomyces]MDQ0404334.1 hypothetical protein [Streptomyces sp. DSM 40167]